MNTNAGLLFHKVVIKQNGVHVELLCSVEF